MFGFSRRQDRSSARKTPLLRPGLDRLDDRLNPVVVANPDTYSVGAGSVLTIPISQGVLVNDFDDEDAGATLISTLVQGPQYTGTGAGGTQAPPLPVGSLNLSLNGSFTFIAPSNYDPNFGNVTFKYQATNRDTTVNNTSITTVTINIVGVAGRQKLFAIASGPGTSSQVRVFDASTGNERYTFFPYEAGFTGGIRVATGDLNKDGVDDIVTIPSQGGSSRVKVYDGKFGTEIEDFQVYEDTFRGGGDVAIGDVDGDQFNDLIVGAGLGGGPRVVVYDGSKAGNLSTPTASTLSTNKLMDFFAYESTFRNGVRVAAGDIDGRRVTDPSNARDYIVTGTFAGGGPAVRIFDGVQVRNNLLVGIAAPTPKAAFFAYDPNGRDGVNVAVGQFRGDGKADIVTGTGAGAAVVRVFDGRSLTQLKEFSVPTSEAPTGNIPVGGGQVNGGTAGGLFQTGGLSAGNSPTSLITTTNNTQSIGGVRVAVADRNSDGISDIVTGIGPGSTSRIRVFDGSSLQEINNFLAFPTTFLGGVFVGGNSL